MPSLATSAVDGDARESAQRIAARRVWRSNMLSNNTDELRIEGAEEMATELSTAEETPQEDRLPLVCLFEAGNPSRYLKLEEFVNDIRLLVCQSATHISILGWL